MPIRRAASVKAARVLTPDLRQNHLSDCCDVKTFPSPASFRVRHAVMFKASAHRAAFAALQQDLKNVGPAPTAQQTGSIQTNQNSVTTALPNNAKGVLLFSVLSVSPWLIAVEFHRASRTGTRRRPNCPLNASNRPCTPVPHDRQRPSPVRWYCRI